MSSAQASYELSGASDAPGRTKGRCVGHRIEIDAPPELVWDFIADFEGWGGWSPLYVETSGRAEPGEEIRFTVKLEGLKPQKGGARVVTMRPNELLEYVMTSFGGLVKAFRFVEVEELSPTRCAVTNAEIMGGPVGAVIFRAMGHKVGMGLEGMNRALRKMAELKWNSRPD
ncbi:SRPBCC domain-containing protein [Novosphingobium mangrovi (ex Huang et al. 2023)]|uniref:SRPBCC domain-containing protein n=1 Tax=Novosphingobium mangrovi (ex Huang et al. 2023) TaxID=2976432 RepID=A0ABT2HZQ3_9SPHN|nr:SRPBCC domain-containing protein [Novosphingobium mangrovi (ex Huang et al. 2023)]MCT2398026.1 SRPBCC domain-containing protein [Novosphingobium mangrovi (ex Huang et al. 2023)]